MEKNNTKLNKIYKILRIILIVFVLFSAMKSCAKAYTFEDFKEITEELSEKGKNSAIIQYTTFFNTNRMTTFKGYLNDNNITFDYDCFICKGVASGANNNMYYIYCITSTDRAFSYATGTGNLVITRGCNYDLFTISYNGNITYEQLRTGTSTSTIISGITFINQQCWGLTNGRISNGNYTTMTNFENVWNYFNLLGATDRELNLLPWYFADARIGSLNYDNNVSFKLYDINDNFKLYLNAIQYDIINGYLYQLEIPYTEGLRNGGSYYVTYNNESGELYKTTNFVISWQRIIQPRRNYK